MRRTQPVYLVCKCVCCHKMHNATEIHPQNTNFGNANEESQFFWLRQESPDEVSGQGKDKITQKKYSEGSSKNVLTPSSENRNHIFGDLIIQTMRTKENAGLVPQAPNCFLHNSTNTARSQITPQIKQRQVCYGVHKELW